MDAIALRIFPSACVLDGLDAIYRAGGAYVFM